MSNAFASCNVVRAVLGAAAVILIAACSASGGKTSTQGPSTAGPQGGANGAGGAPFVVGDTGGTGFIGVGEAGGTGGVLPALDGGATTSRTPISIDACGANNAANLSAADAQKLMAGGAATGLRWLYPYDGTVFPRGLKAPLLMWDAGGAAAPTAVYVHVKAGLFEYKGCLPPTAPGQVQLPQDVWDAAGTRTVGAADPFTVEISTLTDGTVAGPLTEKLVIAQATLTGSIYYDTYNAASDGSLGGAVFRIRPGQDAQYFLRQLTCTGCHSVSSNGTRLIAREIASLDDGQVYELTPTTQQNPAPKRAAASTAFVGLSPDGSVYVSNAGRSGVGAKINGGVPVLGDYDAVMYETDTGNTVANTGIPPAAMMTTFSPDGKLLVFNDYDKGQGHGVSVMKYDAASRTATDYKLLYTDPQAFAGWPFALPDDGAVVYAAGATTDFSGGGAGIIPLVPGPNSDLTIVDVATGTATLLAQAMGFATPQDAASGNTYLPFGATETHHSYYPTVSPVAAGGYIWVFFDSMRNYGNVGFGRQLWGTALTLSADGKYVGDPSHPAFYLAGQQFQTANHRAFTALDPCKKDGESCETGVDCCNGYCTNDVCGLPPTPRCSEQGEACKAASDCCDPRDRCINGFCAKLLQ